jgi:hypothetical protein
MKRLAVAVLLAMASCSGEDPPEDFTDVHNDPANTTGVQFQTPVFEVAQGVESQDCYFFNMPDLNNGQDYWIDHVRLGSNPGSHHANVFRVKTIVALGTPEQGDFVDDGECFKSANWADWPLVVNNQNDTAEAGKGYFDWQLPSGVAYKFSPGERIMVQTHYVNASTQTTPYHGRVALDFYRSSLPNPIEMGTLFATQQSIRICRSNQTPTYHGSCAFNKGGVTIAAANGHFHSRGTKFEILKWDGVTAERPDTSSLFYTSTKWDDPPMTIYQDPGAMQVAEHGGVWWSCAYEWSEPLAEVGGCAALDAADKQQAGDCCYTFGPKVETSEHCNAFVYYYPKVDRTDITCF